TAYDNSQGTWVLLQITRYGTIRWGLERGRRYANRLPCGLPLEDDNDHHNYF
ncbi:hypothetical protein SUGI_0288590, partial [Cryptomeria japonica]